LAINSDSSARLALEQEHRGCRTMIRLMRPPWKGREEPFGQYPTSSAGVPGVNLNFQRVESPKPTPAAQVAETSKMRMRERVVLAAGSSVVMGSPFGAAASQSPPPMVMMRVG